MPVLQQAEPCSGIVSFFFQAEDGIRDYKVTGVQTCALPILKGLDLRDRYAEGEISSHGLASAAGRLAADMERLLAPHYRSPENQRFAKHLLHEIGRASCRGKRVDFGGRRII